MNFQEILNSLADRKVSASFDGSTWSMLLRYEPLEKVLKELAEDNGKEYDPHSCYVFEIGKNYAKVFSSELVKEVRMTKSGAIIDLI